MARKISRVTISAEGRDKGKTFVITELSADQGERWAIRLVQGLIQSGANISEDALHAGMAGIAAVGIGAIGGVSWATLEPLLNEMFDCIQYEHKPNLPLQSIFPGVNSQIEEMATRVSLRLAWMELHLGFSVPEVPPTSATSKGGEPGQTTATFLESLGGWFRKALRHS